ncbi:hypothetical protein [Mycolicibacterium brisbanense]
MSADSPSHPGPSLGTVQELRSLAAALRGVDAATAAAEWGDDAALRVAARTAAGELASLPHIALTDVAAAGASAQWLARAEAYARGVATTQTLTATPEEAAANVVVAVRLARSAVAEAVAQVALARQVVPAVSRLGLIRDVGPVLPGLRRDVGAELRHIMVDRPRAILVRIAITLGIGWDWSPSITSSAGRAMTRAGSRSTCSRRSSAASCAPMPSVSKPSGCGGRCPRAPGSGECWSRRTLRWPPWCWAPGCR